MKTPTTLREAFDQFAAATYDGTPESKSIINLIHNNEFGGDYPGPWVIGEPMDPVIDETADRIFALLTPEEKDTIAERLLAPRA